MIKFIKDSNEPAWHGYVYAVMFFLVVMLETLIRHQYFHCCFTLGMRIRTAIIAAVYNKVSVSDHSCKQAHMLLTSCHSLSD